MKKYIMKPSRIDCHDHVYKTAILELFESKSRLMVDCGGGDHMVTMFVEFFNNAKDRVRIFCTSLELDVYSNTRLLTAIREALNRNITIEVCVGYEPPSDNKFIGALDTKCLVVCNTEMCSKPNFVVMDQCGFWFQADPMEPKAKATAYNKIQSLELNDVFASYI